MPEARSFRRLAAAFAITVAVASLSPVGTADADPLPATYSGATHGDILDVGLTATAIPVTAVIAHSSTTTDSSTANRAHAESANIHAGALGLGVGVVSDSANSTTSTQNDSYAAALGEVDVTGVLDTGLITGNGTTRWDGDAACVPDGTPIAQSTTQVAGATLGITAVEILDLGVATTTGSTTLDNGSVRSTSAGNITSLSLVNGLVDVDVVTQPQLTATSDGTTGSVTANAYAVDVSILGGPPTRVTAGGSVPINLNVGGVTSVNLTLSVGSLTDTSSGATGSGSATFLRITGAITVLLGGATLANVDVGILPLSVSATAPTGGVECDALDPPVIQAPTNGATTGETPTISGTGIPGATVTVTEGATTIGTAVVAPDGTWSLVPSSPLSLGSHTISATQQLGTPVSGASNVVTFTVEDQTAPAAPVVVTPANGSVTNDATPAITGTGESGATLTVSVDGVVVGTTTADGSGNWTFQPLTPLADGPHTVNATQTDPAGNTSVVSNTNTFTVDSTAPAAPVVQTPADGSVTNDTTPTITGTGESGATVTVSVDGAPIGTTTVTGGGTWTLTPSTPLGQGPHTVNAVQTDPAGNTSPVSNTNTFTVDSTAPAAPVIHTPADGSVTSDTTPTISGIGEAGATVEVSIDGTPIGTTNVTGGGTWALTPSTPLAQGPHTVDAAQTDPAGNTSPAASNDFTIDTTVLAPVVLTPADGSVTNDTTPAITGTGEPGAIVSVSVDGTPIGTTTVTGGGTWTLTPATPLSSGEHDVNATQTDLADNTSVVSNTNTFTIDTTAPAAPVIASPADGSIVHDRTPPVSGTGQPGATVEVTVDGTVVGTVPVSGDGTWTFDLTDPLPDGPHTVTAVQTDPAGNTSPPDSNSFTVDVVDPLALTDVPSGQGTVDTTPTFSGTGEPGSTVEISIDGISVGTIIVADDGTWTFTVSDELACGEHEMTAQTVGSSEPPQTTTFTIICDDENELPETGMSGRANDLAGLGLALLLGGVVLVRRGRRGLRAAA